MKRKKYFVVLLTLLQLSLNPLHALAGTITGQIQLSSSGKGLPNGTLTFTLTQAAVVSGTATIVTSPINCYTDALGNVVGLPNPQALPVVSAMNGSGSLPPGNYFLRTTWANSSGETVPGPERNLNITQTGTLVVQAPVNPPANASQWKIYVSTAAGTETLQAVENAPFTNYSQSTALTAGSALPVSNTTTCSLRFNDELQPSYTGYNVTLTTANGAAVPGFPQKWYLSGGSSGSVNVGSGLPLYGGVVVYPQPIITNPAQASTQSINGPLNLNGFKLTDSNINGFVYVDGTTFTTIQQAITSVCSIGGGTVFIPPGTYAQNLSFVLCSNLNLIGAGRGQSDVVTCPTTINAGLTSGDLFPITNMTDIHLSDFCVKNTATAGANAAIRLNYGQRVTAERLYISGPFAAGIQFNSSSTAGASTIWNRFTDVHITGLATNGIGCFFDSADATAKVINNNYLINVACVGGTSGVGIKMTNSNNAQVINENVIMSGEMSATMGTAWLLTNGATRGATCIECNIEGSTTGFSKRSTNTVKFVSGNISANGTNVTDDQPNFTTFDGTNVGGVVQQWAISPAGDLNADGIGLNATGLTNAINGVSGWGFDVSGTQKWDVLTGALAPHTAGGSDIGSASQPVGNLWLGNAATNNLRQTGTFTGARTATWQDASGTVAYTSGSGTYILGCNGTASAGTTITMPWPGAATTACTNTAAALQVPVTSATTVKNLRVRCGSGGVNASSGAFALVQNGGSTSLTCTVGTGTTCNDTTHSVSLSAGDALLVQFTTQAGETLANCVVSLEKS
jgi:hypothetical protein